MWWILALVGLGAFLVLIAAAAWFLLRSRPKPSVDEEDPDFAPRETPARLAPPPADSADEFKPVALPPPVVRQDAEPADADGAGGYAAAERADGDVSAATLTDAYAPAGGAEAAPVAEVPVAQAEAEPAVEAPAVEAPAVEAPAVEAPAVEAPAVEAPAEAPAVEAAPPTPAEPEPAPEEPPVFDMIQKARIAGEDLVLRAHAVRFQDEDLLGFVTEGFGGHGKPDFALYMPMPEGDPIEVIKAGLKFFSFVSLKLQERATPVVADDVLLFPGHIGGLNFGGFLAVSANEPVAVPMGPHVVLLAVPKSRMGTDPAALRALLAPSGVLPYRSELGA